MKITSQYLKQLREDYINSIMGNEKMQQDEPILLMYTVGNNEETVKLLEHKDHYEVKSSWRIRGRFKDIGKAKRLYDELVNELLAEF